MSLWISLGLSLGLFPMRGLPQAADFEFFLVKVDSLEQIGDFEEAENLLSECLENNDEHWFDCSKKSIAMNEKLGNYSDNLSIFNQAHESEYFYFIHRQMPKYAGYLELPGFDSIARRDLLLRQRANEISRTIYEVQLPQHYDPSRSYPLVFIFHGGGRSMVQAKKHWQVHALDHGFIKVFLQSYRHFDSNTFGWGSSDERLDRDVKGIYEEILSVYPVDTTNILAAGISAGATAAIDLSLRKVIPAKGFLAFCPDLPRFLDENPALLLNNDIRGYVSTGSEDPFRDRDQVLATLFKGLDVHCKFVSEPGRGHEYPVNESLTISEGLAFILNQEKIGGGFEEVISGAIAKGLCRGLSIAIADNNQILYYNFGKLNHESSDTPNQQSIFEIGSVSKLFTIFIYQALAEREIVSPSDRVGYYLPEITNPAVSDMTLGLLVNHTSGLPSMPDNLPESEADKGISSYTDEDFIAFLNRLHIEDSQNMFVYSNAGIALLGLVIERASKKSYHELLQGFVIANFNLENTFIKVPESKQKEFASGSKEGMDIDYWEMDNVLAPTGGIRSSAEDLVKFLCYTLYSENYASIRNSMIRDPLQIGEGLSYASAWFIQSIDDRDYFWVSGSTGGFSAFLGFCKENDRCVVMLSNSSLGLKEAGLQLLSKSN
ncbi:MAG: serine hydrolase [Bacteroides sp.]|nr:serine hydrolase [Bacteroides sp.]